MIALSAIFWYLSPQMPKNISQIIVGYVKVSLFWRWGNLNKKKVREIDEDGKKAAIKHGNCKASREFTNMKVLLWLVHLTLSQICLGILPKSLFLLPSLNYQLLMELRQFRKSLGATHLKIFSSETNEKWAQCQM